MIPDPTEEMQEIKHRLGEEMGFNLHRIADDIRRRQRESGRKYVSLLPRRPTSLTADNQTMQRSGGGDVSGNGGSTPAAR